MIGRIPLADLDDPHAFLDEVARRDFVSFLIRAYPYIAGGADLVPNWHLEAIAHRLRQVELGHSKRLLVTLPPRNLKSIMISVAWVAWRLGRDPRLNFVCVSYSNELSAKHARDCRAIIQSAWYQRLFPQTIIAASRSAVHDFDTTAGGGRLATSIDGTLTGRGGDIIIIDDPIKPEEAMSETVRAAVNDWFFSTLASRLNDKKNGAIITVMQRLHQYDLAGMLKENNEWDHLSLPAIASGEVTIPLGRGRSYRRAVGEALHAAREPIAVLEQVRRSIGSVNFAAQYQQNPVPAEGNMIQTAWLRTYEADIDSAYGGQVVQSWDTASKDGLLSDWSVCITALVRRREVFVLDVWRRKVPFPELRKAAVTNALRHRTQVLLIEDQASGMQLIQTLRNECPSGVPLPIATRPDADKRTRLAGVSAMIEAGQLLLPHDAGWLADFKQELLAFPSSRHDDQVDALSQLLIWVDRSQRAESSLLAGPELIVEDDWPCDEASGLGLDPWYGDG